MTLSLGVAVFPDHAEDPDGLLRRADEALYEAKKGGRNRTVISGAAAQAHELREAATTT